MTESKPEHSPVGGSSLARIQHCAGSVNLIKQLEIESESSPYAKEGTDAHTLGEMCLNHSHDAIEYLGRTLPLEHEVTEEMADAVQVYLDFVRGEKKRGCELFIEQRFHVSEIHELAYGTSDAGVYNPRKRKLTVIDYKHGKGVPVESHHNLQLSFYAIGLLLKINKPVDEIDIVIVQPRCYHEDGPIRKETLSKFELFERMGEITEIIEAALKPDAPLSTNPYCRWCAALPLCPEQKKHALEMAQMDFDIVTTYDTEALEQIALKMEGVEAFIKSVRAFMYSEAERGVKFNKFKLVDKKAYRKWKPDVDESAITDAFDFFNIDQITERKLRSPAQLEKEIKTLFPARKKVDKPKRAEQLEKLKELYESKSSGTTLVPVTDKREGVSTGIDFDILE